MLNLDPKLLQTHTSLSLTIWITRIDRTWKVRSIFNEDGVFPCKMKTRNFDNAKIRYSNLSVFVPYSTLRTNRQSQNFDPNMELHFSITTWNETYVIELVYLLIEFLASQKLKNCSLYGSIVYLFYMHIFMRN